MTDQTDTPVTEDTDTAEGVYVTREIGGYTFSATAASERKGVSAIRDHAKALGVLTDDK